MKTFNIFSLTLFTFFTLNSSLYSQNIQMMMVPDSVSRFEIDYTRLMGAEQKFLSGVYGAQYRHCINDKYNFISKVGYVHFSSDFGSQSGLTNIYTGVQIKMGSNPKTQSAVNAGVYLPIGSENGAFGVFYDIYDIGKYAHEALGLLVSYNSYSFFDNGIRLGYELGTDLYVPFSGDDLDSSDSELFGRYALSLLYKTKSNVYFQGEFTGLANITKGDVSFGDSSFHAFSLGFGYEGKTGGMGLYYRNYIGEDLFEGLDGLMGFQFNRKF